MSASLEVKLTKPIDIRKLKHLAELTLKELLDLSFAPTLNLQELQAGVIGQVSREVINHRGQAFVFRLHDRDEEVTLVLVEVPDHPQVGEEEAGLWADISVTATRSPLEYALVASLAIALARETSSKIVDDAMLWTKVLEQTPDDFAREIGVSEPNKDISRAAEVMFGRMPLGQTKGDIK